MTPITRLVGLAASTTLVLGLAACSVEEEAPAGSATEDATVDETADDTTETSDDAAGTGDASSPAPAAAEGDGTLVLYSGRNEELVQPVLDAFTDETGIEVEVRYGDTAAMAAQLLEEGDNSPAEVFLAQDAGALGAVAREGLLGELPAETLDLVPDTYESAQGDWVGLTGRSRVLVYNKEAVSEDELPGTVAELNEPAWTGRVGIAPTNASFQSFVTALRVLEGDDAAAQWLDGLAANDPQVRERNGMIVADVDAGAIDAGLVNHYYLYELADEQGVPAEDLNAALHFFPAGDAGALVNISGIGLVGEQADAEGQALVDYLLSEAGQTYFVEETHEYPMIEGVGTPAGLPALDELETPEIDLNDLDDLQRTIEMITEAGLL
ncbi:iron ABC transporter substrate-binding protein [Ornithinimicrobium cerasi]|uniref:Iron(III) transport system substrate-binding protein n=1 Tax=Ornithinimicrobium cerasi TaxID=2248773 RepID=A0A285VSZ1_9MICO|nr:iron ABC transporter substrate-binding protein [Ornithinimicrobium cerasi]SOC57204.1 iron(III) transport system substrate-binding protein [Ornithinimicrobium cerasi]